VDRPGFFISFEGIEGAGKTTQIALAREALTTMGRPPLLLREPGGTAIGDRIRQLLLDRSHDAMQPMAEFFLFCASRNQLVEAVIRPALAAGQVVVCDRFTDSSLAYQGFARGLPLETLRALNHTATGGLQPDLTLLLDLPVEEGLARARVRRETTGEDDRFEAEQLEFHRRVREGFLALARQEPDRIRIVAANQDPARVAEEIRTLMEHGLSRHPRS
jgi:dTMP kinase